MGKIIDISQDKSDCNLYHITEYEVGDEPAARYRCTVQGGRYRCSCLDKRCEHTGYVRELRQNIVLQKYFLTTPFVTSMRFVIGDDGKVVWQMDF